MYRNQPNRLASTTLSLTESSKRRLLTPEFLLLTDYFLLLQASTTLRLRLRSGFDCAQASAPLSLTESSKRRLLIPEFLLLTDYFLLLSRISQMTV